MYPDGNFSFDLLKDAHIEFSRCFVDNGILVLGRIFAKLGYLHDDKYNKVYKQWYSSIKRLIKRNYRKIDNHFWIGKHTEAWSSR